jgi:hypothetical protein
VNSSNRPDFLAWRQQHAKVLSLGTGGERLKRAANKALLTRARVLAWAIIAEGKARRFGGGVA